jgi:hypothetical protein
MVRLGDVEWQRTQEENIPDGRLARKPFQRGRSLEQTVHRRVQTWGRSEVLRRVLTDVADGRGRLDVALQNAGPRPRLLAFQKRVCAPKMPTRLLP